MYMINIVVKSSVYGADLSEYKVQLHITTNLNLSLKRVSSNLLVEVGDQLCIDNINKIKLY